MTNRGLNLWAGSILARWIFLVMGSVGAVCANQVGSLHDDLMLQLFPWLWVWLCIVVLIPSLRKEMREHIAASKNFQINRKLSHMSQTQRDWWRRRIEEDPTRIKELLGGDND